MTHRLLVHLIVLVMALSITAYSAKGSELGATLRLGARSAGSLVSAQGGAIGGVQMGRQGAIVKPPTVPKAAPAPHDPIEYRVGPGEDVKAVAAKFKISPDDVCGSNPRLATDPTLKSG